MYRVGTKIDITNDFGTRAYLVTAVSADGWVELRKCIAEKQKIRNVRHPLTMTLKVGGNVLIEKSQKK